MSELSPSTRELLKVAREGFEPAVDDRRRLERRLALQLGVAAGVTAAASQAAGTTAGKVAGAASLAASTSIKWVSIKWTLGVLLAVGAAAGGVAAYRARATPAALPAAAVVESVEQAATPPVVVDPPAAGSTLELDPAPLPEVRTKSNAAAPAASAPARSSTSVADEARLLRNADAAVRNGDTAAALALLEQHRRAYPNGVLAEERAAQRVFALCKAGRASQARAEAQRFLQSNPRSQLAGSIREACALAKTK